MIEKKEKKGKSQLIIRSMVNGRKVKLTSEIIAGILDMPNVGLDDYAKFAWPKIKDVERLETV